MKNLFSFHKLFISSIIYINRIYFWEKNLTVDQQVNWTDIKFTLSNFFDIEIIEIYIHKSG